MFFVATNESEEVAEIDPFWMLQKDALDCEGTGLCGREEMFDCNALGGVPSGTCAIHMSSVGDTTQSELLPVELNSA